MDLLASGFFTLRAVLRRSSKNHAIPIGSRRLVCVLVPVVTSNWFGDSDVPGDALLKELRVQVPESSKPHVKGSV